MRTPKLERCKFNGCGAMVLPKAMAQHWTIALHYTANPTVSVRTAPEPSIDVLKRRAQ